MSLYEFKCLKCNDLFEILVMGQDQEAEMKCPKCKSEEFERILSTTNYAMGDTAAGSSKGSVQNRKCSGGSCTTYELPGHSR